MSLGDFIHVIQHDLPNMQNAFRSQLSEYTSEQFGYIVEDMNAHVDDHNHIIFEIMLCVTPEVGFPPLKIRCSCNPHIILYHGDVRSYQIAALKRLCELIETMIGGLSKHLLKMGKCFHEDVIRKIMQCARHVSVVSGETLDPKQRERRVRHIMDQMAQDVCYMYQNNYVMSVEDDVAQVKLYVIDYMHNPQYRHYAAREIHLAGPNRRRPLVSVGGNDSTGSQP